MLHHANLRGTDSNCLLNDNTFLYLVDIRRSYVLLRCKCHIPHLRKINGKLSVLSLPFLRANIYSPRRTLEDLHQSKTHINHLLTDVA
jgi:hypothetical protein